MASIDDVLEFQLRRDDVLIATYPKSGTTWMQEIVWLICNNVDVETAKKSPVTDRCPLISNSSRRPLFFKGLETLNEWPEEKQRIMKTHMPFDHLPQDFQKRKKCKLIYVARNPKDVSVSYYHFNRALTEEANPGTWAEFLGKFSDGSVDSGSWFPHVTKYFKESQKDEEKLYFVNYETLRKDMRSVILKLANFLEKDLTKRQVDCIFEHCLFENMRKNEMVNWSHGIAYGFDPSVSEFMRKGKIGKITSPSVKTLLLTSFTKKK